MATARKQAPDLPGDIEWFNVSRPASLDELRGMTVLLDFSLDSTDASREYLDELNRLAGRFGDELVILCVYLPTLPATRRRSHISSLIDRRSIRFPVLHDSAGQCRELYGVREQPTRVLLDREGCVVGSSQGAGKLPQLERVIAHQLGLRGGRNGSTGLPFRQQIKPVAHSVLRFPARLVASDNRLFIADSGNHRILMVSRQGNILRVYGGGSAGFIDGDAESAAFDNPQGMCRTDEFLYVADTGNHAIRRINLRSNEVETVAGTGSPEGRDLSMLSSPRDCVLNAPTDVLFRRGRLYIAMSGLHQLWYLSLVDGSLGILTGNGEPVSRDGAALHAGFVQPVALSWCDDRCWCVDASANAVRCIDPVTGYVSTLQIGDPRNEGDTPQLQYPFDIKSDERRKILWIADSWNNTILAVDISGRRVLRTVSGRRLNEPCGLAFDGDTLYIANTNAHEVLRVDTGNGHTEALNVTEEYNAI